MPHDVDVTENIWVPLPDGRRLAARLWLPRGKPVSAAVLEYMPYRKRDATRTRDEPIHHWLAAHGYAALRVDMHGSGDSDGILGQEFLPAEADDGVAIVAWIAAQPWCDGDVAMLGKSWGGFAGLMTAMRRPPALKAIIVVCGGDDRYDQSLHFTGGAILCETLWWSDAMMLFNMRPPDPAISGDQWDRMWAARLAANPPWLADWLDHPHRDDFWRQGSVSDRPEAIACAVLAVGGWADYISRSVPRVLSYLKTPRWGIAGPWGHHYPQDGIPGPAIGFLQEVDRFLDTVLKGGAGLADTPMFRAWIADWHQPAPTHVEQTGRWVGEAQWPSPHITPAVWHFARGALTTAPGDDEALPYRGPQIVGLCSPEWLSQGLPGEAPADQRADDGLSLCFDSDVLTHRLDMLGSAMLDVDVTVDRPVALIAARLNAIGPDGASLRVALGILNLTHRDSDAHPTPMPPGVRTRLRITFPETGYSFAPGERIRIALSTSYWPIVWPSPTPVTLTIHTGHSQLSLPIRPSRPEDADLRPFDPPESGPATPITILEPSRLARRITHDIPTGEHVLEVEGDGGFLGPGRRYRLDDTGTITGHTIRKRCTIRADDPLSAEFAIAQTMEFERGDWRVALETTTRMACTADTFVLTASTRAWRDGVVVHEKTWSKIAPRGLV